MKNKFIKKTIKLIVFLSLITLIAVNYNFSFIKKDIYTIAKSDLFSQNNGQSYFGRLNLWYLFVQNGDWNSALALEPKLDKVDINDYKITHQPQELQKNLDFLSKKNNKIADDWVEISRVQSMLGNIEESKNAIKKAYQIDPIRDDISKLFYSINK